jgi:hypothetical protein
LQHVSRDDLKDVWLDVAARFFLHPEEIRVLNKIVSMEIKWQWLMGRIVVKDALRRWLAGPSGRMLHPAGLLMEDVEDGKMILKSPEISDRTPLIRILCSNTGAVASVSSADIEVDLSQIMKEIKNIKAKKEKEPESWRLSS